MTTHRKRHGWLRDLHRGLPLFLLTLALACDRDKETPLDPPALAAVKPHTISGSVLGPDGRNICRTIGSGTMIVQLLNPDFGESPDPFLGQQNINCPRNSYSLGMNAGTAHLRVTLPTDALGELPWRHLEQVEVPDAGTVHDVTILRGTRFGGSATLDGQTFPGVFLQFVYDFNPGFGATSAFSDTLGPGWTEFFGRSPAVLQNGVRYVMNSSCGLTLGTRLISDVPDGGFEFPTEVDALNCTLETGAATRFSHTFTRLVVTPMPGDIGGSLSADLFDRYGVGWGVQFPVDIFGRPEHDPAASHIFNGGLLIGLGTGQVLAGADAGSMMECGATCRDLGINGVVQFSEMRDGSRSVTWQYSDATSAEAAGLEITQVSTDGTRPNDYVVFRYSIRNTSASSVTFHAGFFGDWDIDIEAADDRGGTELGGKLMYSVSDNESGVHAGTMLLGAPVTGNFFFDGLEGTVPTTSDQVQALKGGLRRETAGPGDLRYIQGAGPITLKRGQRKDIAIVALAGETKDQLLANAAVAEADVNRRLTQSLTGVSAASLSPASQAPRAAGGALSRLSCKNCMAR